MTPRAPTLMLAIESLDAREAMSALIGARALAWQEDDPSFPAEVAKLAWRIADAMAVERAARQRGGKRP